MKITLFPVLCNLREGTGRVRTGRIRPGRTSAGDSEKIRIFIKKLTGFPLVFAVA